MLLSDQCLERLESLGVHHFWQGKDSCWELGQDEKMVS